MFKGPFILDDHAYSRENLLRHAHEILGDGDLPEWKAKLFQLITDLLTEDRPIIQQTSGTTGDPKVYELDRKAMIRSARMTLSHFELQPGMKALLCLPTDYIAGKMMVVRAFEGNLTLITAPPTGNPIQELEQYIDFTAMVPLQVFEAIKDPEKLDQMLGTLLIGGGEINTALRQQLHGLQKMKAFETFAMTETLTHFAVRRVNGPDVQPLFRTMKGVTIGSDGRGCLTVSVDGITEGLITTNDLVKIHDPHSFEWLGRYDHVIKTGGIKVIPEQIEAKIREQIEAKIRELTGRELLVLGLPDAKLGQKLVLLIEGGAGGIEGSANGIQNKTGGMQSETGGKQSETGGKQSKKGWLESETGWLESYTGSMESDIPVSVKETLLSRLKEILARHEIPREIFFIPSIPRNQNRKPDRNAAKKLIEGK